MKIFIATTLFYFSFLLSPAVIAMEKNSDVAVDKKPPAKAAFRTKNCKANIEKKANDVIYTVGNDCSFHNFVTLVLLDYCTMNKAANVTITNGHSSRSYTINEANCRKIYSALNITTEAETSKVASSTEPTSRHSSATVNAPVVSSQPVNKAAITPPPTAPEKKLQGTHLIQFYAGNNRPNMDKITCKTANASLVFLGNKYYVISAPLSYDNAKAELKRLKRSCNSNGWIRSLSTAE